MLYKRVIPCLLYHQSGLYKSYQFKKFTYIGDPLNAIKIFNNKEVDELMFFDIDSTVNKTEPNFKLIADIAGECFMPLCYGGGIKSISQMQRIYQSGVEKISISSAAITDPNLIKEASKIFGSSSIVVTIDVKKNIWGKYKVFTHNGKINTNMRPLEMLKIIEENGAGEIVINNIDKDGTMTGFDGQLLKEIKTNSKIPVIALGGASKIQDIENAYNFSKVDAVACGSLFVFQGSLRGVLINYLSKDDIKKINLI